MFSPIFLASVVLFLPGLTQANSELKRSTAAGSLEAPLSGRPDDFSGAIGTFHVETHANPTAVESDAQLVLTVRISGKGNLHEIKPLDLERSPSFAWRFRVRKKEQRLSADGRAVEFDYRLFPRNVHVTSVPPVRFVYYRPGLGYQTSYAPSIPIV